MKTVVMIPTFNEKDNIVILIRKILDLKIPDLGVIVVDDDSPDGTWKKIGELNNKKVKLILRKGKRGRGLAGKEGFRKALSDGAKYIIEMDGDLSHDPKYIPKFLEKIEKYDIVIGSRLIAGSRDVERGQVRKIITRISNYYLRIVLGIKVADINSGYRCFKRNILEKITENLKATGPDIVQEVLYKANQEGASISEIPIEFKERFMGKSKFELRYLIKGLMLPIKLRLQNG